MLARVTNPETGDHVVIERSVATGEHLYSLNGGPQTPIPARFGQQTHMLTGKMLLLEHARACEPCDAEEQTLP